jgi:hypothetical protein
MTRIPPASVSDHACLRYFERVYGLDLDALKREILTPEVCAQIAAGAVTVNIRGHKAPVENGCIRTILPLNVPTKGKYHQARMSRNAGKAVPA